MSDAAPATRTDETDIAYLKRLASAGRGGPAPFLLLIAVFGGGFGAAFAGLSVQVALTGVAGPEPLGGLLRWSFAAAHLAFLAALIWTVWRTFGPGRTRLSRAATATWSGAFIGLVTTLIAFGVFTGEPAPSDNLDAAYLLPSVLLVLWGGAWWVTAILNDRPWLLLVAVGSFAAAILMARMGNTAALPSLTAACLLLLAFLPAVLLMRERRG